jgi:hypothetical protein
MRTLWPIGSVSEETLLFLSTQTFSSSASEGIVLLGAAERAKTLETKTTHMRHVRGWIVVLQRVTIQLLSRARQYPPLQGGPAFFLPYSPECVEGEFSELRIDGVLGSSRLVSS